MRNLSGSAMFSFVSGFIQTIKFMPDFPHIALGLNIYNNKVKLLSTKYVEMSL